MRSRDAGVVNVAQVIPCNLKLASSSPLNLPMIPAYRTIMDERDDVGLQGTIETLPASDVLGALCAHGSTGVLEMRGDTGRLSLSLLGGFLVAGDMERLFGSPKDRSALTLRLVDVLCSMLRVESGSYEFRDGAIERPSEARIDLHDVLSRAVAVTESLRALGSSVPSLDAIPILIESDEDAPITLNRSMLRLVSHVDEIMSIAQIAELIGLSAYEAAVPIAELIDLGILGSFLPDALSGEHAAPLGTRSGVPSANSSSSIAEATRDSVELAASLVEAHRSPYSDAAEQALADLAGGDESIEQSFDSALNSDESEMPHDMENSMSGDELMEMDVYAPDELNALLSEASEMSGAWVAGDGEEGDGEEGDDELSGDLQQTTITADRGALLRLFSGLRTDHG